MRLARRGGLGLLFEVRQKIRLLFLELCRRKAISQRTAQLLLRGRECGAPLLGLALHRDAADAREAQEVGGLHASVQETGVTLRR